MVRWSSDGPLVLYWSAGPLLVHWYWLVSPLTVRWSSSLRYGGAAGDGGPQGPAGPPRDHGHVQLPLPGRRQHRVAVRRARPADLNRVRYAIITTTLYSVSKLERGNSN